jgi:hypothetical protein
MDCPSKRCPGYLGPILAEGIPARGVRRQEWRECGRCGRLVDVAAEPADEPSLPGMDD